MGTKYFQKILLYLFLFFSATLFSQKTTFIIGQNYSDLRNKIDQFKNKDVEQMIDGASEADAKVLVSYIRLSNLQYNLENENEYLNLKLKGSAEKNQLISAEWIIEFKRLTELSTEITIKLWGILPKKQNAPKINVKKALSTGKLEAEIKNLLES